MGVIIGRAFPHKKGKYRGYIGMLAVAEEYRRKYKIGSELLKIEIEAFQSAGVEEVSLKVIV